MRWFVTVLTSLLIAPPMGFSARAADAPLKAPVTVSNLAKLRAVKVRKTSPAVATVLAHTTVGDGGGGVFLWSEDSKTPDDNGMIVSPSGRQSRGRWVRQTDHTELRAAWWGVWAEREDNLDQLQAVANYCESLHKTTLPRLLLPHGELKIRDTWEYSANARIEGSSHTGGTTIFLTKRPTKRNAIMVPLHWAANKAVGYAGTSIERLTVKGQAVPGDASDYDGIVWMSWFSSLRHLSIAGINGYAIRATARTADGTLSPSSFVRHLVEWVNVRDGKGMVWGEPEAPKYTDGLMVGCIFDAGTGSLNGYVLEFHASGGWRVNDCVFNHPLGGALKARGELFCCTNTRFDGLWARGRTKRSEVPVGKSTLQKGIVISGQGKSKKGRGVFFSSNYIEIDPNAPEDFIALSVDASDITEPISGVAQVSDNKFTAMNVMVPGTIFRPTKPENMSLIFNDNSFQGEDHIVFYDGLIPERTAQHDNTHFKRDGTLRPLPQLRQTNPSR